MHPAVREKAEKVDLYSFFTGVRKGVNQYFV
jgi:hypothetical protein